MRKPVTAIVAACAQAFVAVLLATVVLAAGQDIQKKKDDSRLMVVQGCVNGSILDVHHADLGRGDVSAPYDHFKLRGNKDLMKALTKDLRGHLVEVAGVVNDPAAKQGGGKTIPIGTKTTITVNQREVSKLPDPATDPVMNVESYRDLEPNCAGK